MITKAIIEEVGSTRVVGELVTTYTVRLPIFHGYEDPQETPTEYLPKAVYCSSAPHSDKTQFRKGDIVYVAIEDFDLSSIVILGMIPIAQTTGLKGSRQTESKYAIEKVETFLMDKKEGNAELPYDIKIFTDNDTDEIIEKGDLRNFVNGEEISYLKFVDSPIQDQINSARKLSMALAEKFDYKAEITASRGVSGATINSTTWLERSGCLAIEVDYTFRYNSNIWKFTDIDGSVYNYTRERLAQKFGISYSSASGNATITVQVTASPLLIKYGGTEADNTYDARKNIGVFADEIISFNDFKNKVNNNKLEPRRIYYIYTSVAGTYRSTIKYKDYPEGT